MIPDRHPFQFEHTLRRGSLPKVLVLRAYEVYEHVFGSQPAMINDGCRGGFGLGELLAFLYARSFPKEEWSRRVDEALK